MRLTPNQRDMLYRVALAEYSTSPSTPPKYNRGVTIRSLERNGLIEWDKAFQLTDAGREHLRQLSDDQRAQLDRLAARRRLVLKGRT